MKQDERLEIHLGHLRSVPSLWVRIAPALRRFSELYNSGVDPVVVYDLTGLVPRRMGISALTVFLAIAHRLRKFSVSPPQALIKWDPNILSFWDDISFLQITQDCDLLRWPEGMIGGYVPGKTNPHTKILMFPLAAPDSGRSGEYVAKWKHEARTEIRDQLLLRCGQIFRSTGRAGVSAELRDQIAITGAELAVNSLLHGDAVPFVGLQRSTRGITVSVADSGRGFLRSMQERTRLPETTMPDAMHALVFGSFVNRDEMGLRRAIQIILKCGGWITMSSGDGEVVWRRSNWSAIDDIVRDDELTPELGRKVVSALGPPLRGRVDPDAVDYGYHRQWSTPLRGTRIAFEISFEKSGEHTYGL